MAGDIHNLEGRFLQSPEWENFLHACRKETFRVEESLFVVETLPFGFCYTYSPRGPLRGGMGHDSIAEAKKRGCGWIRIEPNTEEKLKDIRESFVFCRSPRDIQPREILVMDVSMSEEALLAHMKPKTRYNIRLAKKKGVEIIVSDAKEYRDRFFELVSVTSGRAGIRSHSREHYEKLLDALGPEKVQLYCARYQGEIIAINMMIFYQDIAIYLHGGSSNTHRNVMAPFLLQWQAIQDAKKRGCRWYDFGGISTNNNEKRNDWKGITNFKQGFCPETQSITFPGTYDIVLNPWKYEMYTLLIRLRRIFKGLIKRRQ